jgi:ubiquinone/menaquinone biosynthesis C-methylase UbiE
MADAQMHSDDMPFVPALGFHWLTRFYDPFIALMLRERPLKQKLVDQAKLTPGCAVLDFGCGTGTLAMLVKRACPSARVVGIDADPQVLAIARQKIAAAGLEIELQQGFLTADTFPTGSFDRIVSSLVLHHLTRDEKLGVLRAMRGALRPGGELHVADFGMPHSLFTRIASGLVQAVDGAERIGDNLAGRLPEIVATAGFSNVATLDRRTTPFGALAYLRATAP